MLAEIQVLLTNATSQASTALSPERVSRMQPPDRCVLSVRLASIADCNGSGTPVPCWLTWRTTGARPHRHNDPSPPELDDRVSARM